VAAAILRALGRNGNRLTAQELRNALVIEFGILPGDGLIQSAARLCRDRGIALVTTAARQHSTWKVAPPGTYDYDQWVTWILTRHYRETISAYRALAPNAALGAQKGMLYRSAMDVGFLISRNAADINNDLTQPFVIEQELKDALSTIVP